MNQTKLELVPHVFNKGLTLEEIIKKYTLLNFSAGPFLRPGKSAVALNCTCPLLKCVLMWPHVLHGVKVLFGLFLAIFYWPRLQHA